MTTPCTSKSFESQRNPMLRASVIPAQGGVDRGATSEFISPRAEFKPILFLAPFSMLNTTLRIPASS